MNKSLNIVKEFISFLEKYSQEKGNEPSDFKEFILWVNEYIFDNNQSEKLGHGSNDLNIELTFLLITQSKYYKAYVKKALLNSEINTADSYSFLYHLSLVDSFRKMELINIHMLEAPSGIEIIKRLLKKGLIEEFDDKDDKRAKRVKITKKGLKEIDKLKFKMQEVYSNMSANMDLNEKLHIISFLRRFSDFHKENTD
ncbi:MAG: MarR family transcriptional regulator [Prolixibacteraceae bacterium]|jgi:MarR family transcriptional regulator, lower aerobic nicotinate degradation pathway regulator|nr:MarR family transcriptional regulator [Prolixibacteraceae bacterium]MBT6005969.1 MarR family transcriptional regulator [Prolixibacteraceae bacterium]MBT7000756.1 MarR family transcriptional regulator [Prolixibacteraceae bacterium]MBT7394868.1 MarR family transcriptional regulator [Prolixibacteraceae bacterium]